MFIRQAAQAGEGRWVRVVVDSDVENRLDHRHWLLECPVPTSFHRGA